MSRKLSDPRNSPSPQSPLPSTLHLSNMINQQNFPDVVSLRSRIEELESKVSQLESRIRSKRKRVRRKSCDVEKKYTCEICKRTYGSIVSLNLHLRIKHRREKRQKKPKESEESDAKESKVA